MIKPQYKGTPDQLSEGQYSGLRVDSTGALVVSSGSAGSTDDGAWNGSDDNASIISLLKAIYEKLDQIEQNTSGV